MILVEHLTKYYGDVAAVKDLSFEIGEGHVYGFLGPNGAGKSTTMNILTGCLSATEGRVEVGGYDIFEHPREAKRLIGYLPEQPPLYLHETPLEYLSFVGEAKGLKGPALRDQVDRAVERTGLGGVLRRPVAALSKGYKQRVGIAQALLADPKVVILDEPTVGLDPLQIAEIRDLIRALGRDHTVLFSSHILSEVQAICDQLLILSHGALAAAGPTGELEHRLRSGETVAFAAEADAQAVLDALTAIVAAVPALALCALAWTDPAALKGLLPRLMRALSLFDRFDAFVSGVFDLTAIVFYLSAAALFLFLTVESLEKRRYNG